jgi:hypothetical protein
MDHVNERCGPDPYSERVRATLAEINQPDYRLGMVSWLERSAPEIYIELIERIPNEIDRLWSARASLTVFEQVLVRFTRTYREARELYLKHPQSNGGAYADFSHTPAKHKT